MTTMSLAVLPSAAPMACGQVAVPALRPPSPSPAKRPRLSLNTSIPSSVFGKGATSLKLETLSATSPTIRNTFSNAHSPVHGQKAHMSRPKPVLTPDTAAEPLESDQASRDADTLEATSAASSTSSVSSISTDGSFGSFVGVPYKIPYHITSILTNSPLPVRTTRTTSFTPSRPMFPESKTVTFRSPLTEEIKTSIYTMKHSDLESSSSTISTLELPPPEQSDMFSGECEHSHNDERDCVDVVKSSPRVGDKRESSDEDDSDSSCPATPVAGRKKRHRQWVWTLEPVSSQTQEIRLAQASENATQADT